MPPGIALLAYSILLLVFVWIDSRRAPKSSLTLWVPVLWLFFMGSRLPSQWLGTGSMQVADAFAEGSPLDRFCFLVLMAVAAGVLATKRINWVGFLARNGAVALFLVFALVSVVWSDFPFITFKRWSRDLGTYVIVALVLSQSSPLDAIATVIRRTSYLLVFLSTVLIKYYTHLSVSYNQWSGAPEYMGATTSKNMLGAVCLIAGTFFFWDTLRRWPERKTPGTKPVLVVNIILIAMTLWLLTLSNSATSTACLAIGCGVVALLRGKWATAHPRVAATVIPVTLVVYIVLELAFNLSDSIAEFLGRDPSLTGRTGIWSTLLGMGTNPLLGVGYQSFWLGERLEAVLGSLNAAFLNEAHNGYLEIYLALGLIGLSLVVLIMLSSYWRLSRQLAVSPPLASLGLAFWSISIVYNVTEAAFGASLLWSSFLLCAMVVPRSMAPMPARRAEEALHDRRGLEFPHQAGVTARRRVPRRVERAHVAGVRKVGR
jgi:O-antigen ligase